MEITILNRLKMELNNKDYFTDAEYEVFLKENNLTSNSSYEKSNMQRDLLLTVVDILEAVANDVDLMRKVSDNTTGLSVSEAYKLLQARIQDIKTKVASISVNDEYSNVGLLFTGRRR